MLGGLSLDLFAFLKWFAARSNARFVHRNITRILSKGSPPRLSLTSMRALFATALFFLLGSSSALASWQQASPGGVSTHIYTPSTDGPLGLLIGLHGCTQSAQALRDRGNWEPAAEDFGLMVALPSVPNGGVIAGCWDYYGAAHTRDNRHNGAVLEMVRALQAQNNIDASRVYIAGLSSGASQAAVLGCLAPDIFAGVGINAGPTVGTAASQIAIVSTTAAEGAQLCRSLAGSNASALSTQLASIIYGSSDFIVSKGYNALNAEVLSSLYDAPQQDTFDISSLQGHNPSGTGTSWSDSRGPRVSLIEVQGMGHAFPAGSGPGAEISFIATEGPAWPYYLASFFQRNDRRAGTPPPPRDAGARDVPPAQGDASEATDASDAPDGGVPSGGDAASDAGPKVYELPGGCSSTPASGDWPILWVLLSLVFIRTARR